MPKVTRFGSSRLVSLSLGDYIVDWDRAVSGPQKKVKNFLRRYWASHVVTEELRIPGSLMRVDLMDWTTHVAVEVSPKGSHSFNKFFHKNQARFGAAMDRELDKTAWLEKNGFTVCEIYDEDFDVLSPAWFRDKYDVEL